MWPQWRKQGSILDGHRPKPKPGIHEHMRQTLKIEWCPSKSDVNVPIAGAPQKVTLFGNKMVAAITT